VKSNRDISARPSAYIIDVCGRCNLKCPLCPQGARIPEHEQPVKYMSLQNFETIFRRIKPYAKSITLHNWAEPFLHPELAQIIKLVNLEAPDVFLHISSNGVILNEERLKKLSGVKIDFLEISISGVTQSTYEKYHRNGDLKKVLNNIGSLINNRELEITKLSIKYLQFDYNILSYFTIKSALLKSLGIDKFPPFVELKIIPGYVTAAVSGYENKYPDVIEKHKSRKIPMRDACNYPFEQLVVRSDGEIFPCCVVPYDQKFSLGNLLSMEFGEFSASPKYNEFRDSFVNGTNPVCNSCYLITQWYPELPFDRRLIKTFNRLTNKFLSLAQKIKN
jgi:radical SAM protein with 4Fe4S-binding SPASM domain